MEKQLRSKTSGVNISNLYELGKSLSPYINTPLNFHKNVSLITDQPISNDQQYSYTLPSTEIKNTNIVVSCDLKSTFDHTHPEDIVLNGPSGKLSIINSEYNFPGSYETFTLLNSFIKSNSNILLTIGEFESTAIPIATIQKMERGKCIIRVYNAGTDTFPNTYDINFLVV
jgi:hypothetical protein